MKALVLAGALAITTLAGSWAGAAAAAEPGAGEAARTVSWRCDGDSCAGGAPSGPSDAALFHECVKVVSVVGPLSRYQSHGRELSAHALAQCNRRATRTPPGMD